MGILKDGRRVRTCTEVDANDKKWPTLTSSISGGVKDRGAGVGAAWMGVVCPMETTELVRGGGGGAVFLTPPPTPPTTAPTPTPTPGYCTPDCAQATGPGLKHRNPTESFNRAPDRSCRIDQVAPRFKASRSHSTSVCSQHLEDPLGIVPECDPAGSAVNQKKNGMGIASRRILQKHLKSLSRLI